MMEVLIKNKTSGDVWIWNMARAESAGKKLEVVGVKIFILMCAIIKKERCKGCGDSDEGSGKETCIVVWWKV